MRVAGMRSYLGIASTILYSSPTSTVQDWSFSFGLGDLAGPENPVSRSRSCSLCEGTELRSRSRARSWEVNFRISCKLNEVVESMSATRFNCCDADERTCAGNERWLKDTDNCY